MNTICTKCGSDEVYVVQPELEKLPDTQTMDEFAENIHKPVPAIYRMTTLKCKKCGYEVNY